MLSQRPLKTVSLVNLDLPPTQDSSHHQDYYNFFNSGSLTNLWDSYWGLMMQLVTPGTQVSQSLFGRLLPWHLACGPLWVGTGRRGWRRLHGAEAASGGNFITGGALRELGPFSTSEDGHGPLGESVWLYAFEIGYVDVYGYYRWGLFMKFIGSCGRAHCGVLVWTCAWTCCL